MADVHPDTSSPMISDLSSIPLQITTDLMDYNSPLSTYPLTPLSNISDVSPPSFAATSPYQSIDCPLSPCESPNESSISDDIKRELLWNDMVLVSPSPPPSTSEDYRRYQLPQAPPPLLPPCRICEEKASGFHYGVNTCEACKRFFRRSMARSRKYTCNALKNCAIGKGRRDICAYCRYQRCISAGMSKQATRKGRYSYEKKTLYTIEVKGSTVTTSQQDAKLMAVTNPLQENSSRRNTSDSSSPTTYSASPTNDHSLHLFDSVSTSPVPGILIEDEPNEIMRSVVDFLDISKSPVPYALEIELTSTRDGWTSDQPIPNWSGSNKMIDEYEVIIRQISDANRIYSPVERLVCNTPDFRAKQEEYYHQWRQSRGMFADMKPLCKQEYLDFYEATGIDLDNRRHIAKLLSNRIEQGVYRMIQFVKSIPGFKDLPLDDQAELIKAFRFEWWMLSFYRGMYPEFGIGTYCTGDFYHKEELVRVYDVPEYVNSVFSFSQTLQNINMSTDESAMLKSIAIMAADRVSLKNRDLVEGIQWQLVQCFQYLLRTRYPDDKGRFARIMDRLLELRSISHWNNNLSKNLTKHWPEFGRSQLLFEVFSL